MGIRKQRTVHKKLANYGDRIDVIEGILQGGLWIALVLSVTGFIITCAIDPIRGRILEINWLQITGMAVFVTLIIVCVGILWLINEKWK